MFAEQVGIRVTQNDSHSGVKQGGGRREADLAVICLYCPNTLGNRPVPHLPNTQQSPP